jgi:hypothetical protein
MRHPRAARAAPGADRGDPRVIDRAGEPISLLHTAPSNPRQHRHPLGPDTRRLRYLAARLHGLGPRATYEFLREIAAGADLWCRLERYAELDPDIVRALGARELPDYVRLVPREEGP